MNDIQKMVMNALARHGAMPPSLIASHVECTEDEAIEAAEALRRDGKLTLINGKNARRYQIREIAEKE